MTAACCLQPLARMVLIVTFVVSGLTACSRPADQAEHDEHAHHGSHAEEDAHGDGAAHEDHHEEGRVVLTPEQIAATGIVVQPAMPGRIDRGIALLGEVRPNGDRIAHIVPRFPGIARDVRRRLGDSVQAGDVLAVIESSESLAPYDLKTLIDGVVIEKHITRGEAVSREQSAFIVADLSTVWVDLAVYQKDLRDVRTGQAVRITGASDAPAAEGVVSYITPVVDQQTRTATVRVVLQNRDGDWRPGTFVTAHLLDPLEARIAIPKVALQTIEQRSVVFVEHDGAFEPRDVRIGRSGDTQVEVAVGLNPGELFVAANSFILKAELGKGAAEHDH